MCESGVLWSFRSQDATTALGHRDKFLNALGRHRGWSVDVYAARIIFTELVTNVMRHACGPIGIVLECDGRHLALKIRDRGPGFEFAPSLPADILSEGGRGLFLISKVAAGVRVEQAAYSGTIITAVLPRMLPS
jgi:anti-sigma regulatory factor (Ser/Thr protein kinase)